MDAGVPRFRDPSLVSAPCLSTACAERYGLRRDSAAEIGASRCAVAFALCCILACLAAIFSSQAPAAESSAPPSAPKPTETPAKPDHLGRSTPYGTVIGFLRAADKDEYQLALNYLEIKQPSKKNDEQLVRDLRVVLHRGLKVGLDDLSRSPEGHLDDGLSVYAEKVGTVAYGDEKLDIVLRRTTRPDTPSIWLFAPETLLGVAVAAAQLDLAWGERIWPESFRQTEFLGHPLFMLVNLIVFFPLLIVASWLLAKWLLMLLRPGVLGMNKEHGELAINRVRWLMALLVFAILTRALAPHGTTVGGRILLTTAASVLITVAVTWLAVRITNLGTRWKIANLQRAGMPSSIAAVELSSWLIGCVFVIIGLFLILRTLGFEITAAIAGLGVGGIAIAFAAQKTLENLFGTVTIVTDKPIRVGDYCQAGTTEGNVESIGLRSTRIRTPDRSLVTIPNGQLATMTVGNISERDKFLFRHIIRLRYDSTATQLRHVLAQIKKLMLAEPQLEPVTVRTRLVRFSEYSLELEVFAYVLTRDALAFLEIQESLLLRIMDIVEVSGTSVALPYPTPAGPADTPARQATQERADIRPTSTDRRRGAG